MCPLLCQYNNKLFNTTKTYLQCTGMEKLITKYIYNPGRFFKGGGGGGVLYQGNMMVLDFC